MLPGVVSQGCLLDAGWFLDGWCLAWDVRWLGGVVVPGCQMALGGQGVWEWLGAWPAHIIDPGFLIVPVGPIGHWGRNNCSMACVTHITFPWGPMGPWGPRGPCGP